MLPGERERESEQKPWRVTRRERGKKQFFKERVERSNSGRRACGLGRAGQYGDIQSLKRAPVRTGRSEGS